MLARATMLSVVATISGLAAQEVKMLGLIDRGVGGLVTTTQGAHREFHLEASGVCARLMPQRTPGEGARVVAVDSEEERLVLTAIDAWLDGIYSAEERAELLALPSLPSPRTQEEQYAYQIKTLLRTAHLYREVTHPEITKVFAGRGTVTTSMWIGLGGSAPQQVLWRRLGDDPFARMHLDTATESIAVDSRAETRLLLGIRFWLAARLGSEERVWSVSAAEANELAGGVGQVLAAYRGYLEATSPRIRDAGTFMDRASGGSKFFGIADPQSRVRTFRFDWKAQTKTPGRLFEDDVLIELGSALEKEALDLLSRAATLRRGFQGDRAGDDAKLKMLDEQLDGYRKSFVQKR